MIKNSSKAFISDYSGPNSIVECAISGTSLSSCVHKSGDSSVTISQAAGIALSKDEQTLYVVDSNSGNVNACDTTETGTALFSHCAVATHFTSAWGLAVNETETFAYVTDYQSKVSVCPILADKTFGACTVNATFGQVANVVLAY